MAGSVEGAASAGEAACVAAVVAAGVDVVGGVGFSEGTTSAEACVGAVAVCGIGVAGGVGSGAAETLAVEATGSGAGGCCIASWVSRTVAVVAASGIEVIGSFCQTCTSKDAKTSSASGVAMSIRRPSRKGTRVYPLPWSLLCLSQNGYGGLTVKLMA